MPLTPAQKAAATKARRYGVAGLSEIARRAAQARNGVRRTKLCELERHCVMVAKSARGRSRRNGLCCDQNLEEIAIELLRQQKYSCAVSGVQFSLERLGTGKASRALAPSLDRMDATRGYTRDNIRLVCWAANCFMGTWGERVAARVATGIAMKRRHRP